MDIQQQHLMLKSGLPLQLLHAPSLYNYLSNQGVLMQDGLRILRPARIICSFATSCLSILSMF